MKQSPTIIVAWKLPRGTEEGCGRFCTQKLKVMMDDVRWILHLLLNFLIQFSCIKVVIKGVFSYFTTQNVIGLQLLTSPDKILPHCQYRSGSGFKLSGRSEWPHQRIKMTSQRSTLHFLTDPDEMLAQFGFLTIRAVGMTLSKDQDDIT